MPIKAYRASTAFASAHVSANLGLWMVIAAVFTALMAFLTWTATGRSSAWGHGAAFGGMVLGILIMMKAQEGYVAPDAPDED